MELKIHRFSAVSKIAVIAIIIITLGYGNVFSQAHIFLNDKTDVFGVIIENNSEFIVLQDFDNSYLKIRKEAINNIAPLYVNAKILNGTNVIGKVTAMTDDAIRINSNYTSNRYEKSSIIFITPISYKEYIEANPAFEEIDNFEVYNAYNMTFKEYFSFGLSFGFGGIPNILTSYNYSKNGAVSIDLGFYKGDFYSLRLKHSLTIVNKPSFENNVSLSLGYFGFDYYFDDDYYKHFAPIILSYDMNFFGIFAEVGLGYNIINNGRYIDNEFGIVNVNDDRLFLMFQVGYKYRFN